MLKKQTVWLLTMLSLMIVLSVYYMSSPSGEDFALLQNPEDQAATSEATEGDAAVENSEATTEEAEATDDTVTSSISSDEVFASIRMNIEDQRSAEKERLESIVASSSASSDEKEEAYAAMNELDALSTREKNIEDTLMANNGYEDVLVRSNGEDVVVTVKVDELPSSEVVSIMRTVKDEFGEVEVEVEYQPVG
ncbi:SpoIIIAH-like family protein [Aquibacillus kalidii]|uniref:SpoIIIAH-like family protein n=1 Tax=Aquibacillus kalidii TaxID=2762597 RepID=UPI001648DD97|nr:SpoIIIAH-like family protein [Aquibacillus kalidii]